MGEQELETEKNNEGNEEKNEITSDSVSLSRKSMSLCVYAESHTFSSTE